MKVNHSRISKNIWIVPGFPNEQSSFADKYWDTHLSFFEEDTVFKIQAFRCILPEMMGTETRSVLEIGCGSGGILRKIADEYSFNIRCGCDISMKALQRASDLDKQGSYVLCDAHNLPFENNSFDLVLLADVLEHVPEPKVVLAEAARVGKIVCLKIPCEANIYNKLRIILGKISPDYYKDKYGHLQAFSYWKIKKMLNPYQAKLKIVPLKRHQNLCLDYGIWLFYTLLFGGFGVAAFRTQVK